MLLSLSAPVSGAPYLRLKLMSYAIKTAELIFLAPWVFSIAVAIKDVLHDFWVEVLREFWMVLRRNVPWVAQGSYWEQINEHGWLRIVGVNRPSRN